MRKVLPQSPTNFLSFIAHRYQKKAEDVGTDVTAYLLGKSSGKQALRNLLSELGWYGLSSFDVRSRPRQEDGIPDLCLMQNEKLHVIIENKFWARLTPAQPCAYLDMVSRSNGLVLFVVPKERKQAVWSELLSRCSDASRPVKTTTSKLIGQSGKASLATISWEELVQCFQRSFTEETELVFVNELGRLANMAEKDQIGPLDGGTLGNTALAKQVVFYARLADAIADAAADKGYFVFVNALRKGAVGVGYS